MIFRKFVILDITKDVINSTIPVIVVKANEVEPVFVNDEETLEESFSLEESEKTEYYIISYSKEAEHEFKVLKDQNKDNQTSIINFWSPNYADYINVTLCTPRCYKNCYISVSINKDYHKHKINTTGLYYPPNSKNECHNDNLGGIDIVSLVCPHAVFLDKLQWYFPIDSTTFIFPRDNRTHKLIVEIFSLDSSKKEFWKPEFNEFYSCRISYNDIEDSNRIIDSEDILISKCLPKYKDESEEIKNICWFNFPF